jgi:hypothetical protein
MITVWSLFFVFFSTNVIILSLSFKVGIVNLYAEHFCFKKDLNSDPKEALEARNLHGKVNSFGAQRNPSFQHLIDVLVKVVRISLSINVKAFVEVEPK